MAYKESDIRITTNQQKKATNHEQEKIGKTNKKSQ